MTRGSDLVQIGEGASFWVVIGCRGHDRGIWLRHRLLRSGRARERERDNTQHKVSNARAERKWKTKEHQADLLLHLHRWLYCIPSFGSGAHYRAKNGGYCGRGQI